MSSKLPTINDNQGEATMLSLVAETSNHAARLYGLTAGERKLAEGSLHGARRDGGCGDDGGKDG